MKTNYFGHDRVYKHKREIGETGWDSPEQVEQNFEHVCRLLGAASVPPSPLGLELGCGAGDITLRMAKAGWRMHGVDLSPTAIEWAREKAQALGLDVGFHLADIVRGESLPIGPVDAVIDGHCLHCIIGQDRDSFFSYAKRHLKNNGHLLIDTMCGDPRMDDAKRHFDPATRCLIYNGVAGRYLGRADDILQEITDAGFAVLKSEIIEAFEPEDQHTLLAIACNLAL